MRLPRTQKIPLMQNSDGTADKIKESRRSEDFKICGFRYASGEDSAIGL